MPPPAATRFEPEGAAKMTLMTVPQSALETHDHVWRPLSPVNVQYGVGRDDYLCTFCGLTWRT